MLKHFISVLFYLDTARIVVPFRWSYEDESKWPGSKCNGVGLRQSPIDIQTSDVVKDFSKEFIKYGPLDFDGYHRAFMTAFNNRYTEDHYFPVMFSTEGGEAFQPTLAGGPLGQEYRLEQMHFHWLSEHAIDGAKYPLEIHFVHIRSDLDVKMALKKKNGLAIVATLCKIIEHEDQLETAFDDLTLLFSKMEKVGTQVSGVLLNLTKLLSPAISQYYTYYGSLTSPLCNEVVTWIVFPDHIYITEAQFALLEKVRHGRYNYRRLQRLDGRRVYQPPSDFLVEPQIVTSIRNAVQTVTGFFTNVTNFFMNGLQTP